MRKKLKRVDPMSAAIFSTAASLLAGILGFVFSLLIPARDGFMGGAAIGLIALIVYPIAGFIGGLLGAVIYNLVAGFTGGVVVELEDA